MEEQRKIGLRKIGLRKMVDSIVGQVSASATSMLAIASQTSAPSTAVAAAAEEADTNVNTAAVAAAELGSTVQEIGRQVQDLAQLVLVAVGEADQTGALVQGPSTAVGRIGDLVGPISSIAGQTNLLALNATIEAAHEDEVAWGGASPSWPPG